MGFVPKQTRKKANACYMTIYITVEMRDKLEGIAAEYDTSLNNVVVSMMEQCLAEDAEESPDGGQNE